MTLTSFVYVIQEKRLKRQKSTENAKRQKRMLAFKATILPFVFEINKGQLNGTIPQSIANLAKLTLLDLSYNEHLTGSIPPEISNLQFLKELNLVTRK